MSDSMRPDESRLLDQLWKGEIPRSDPRIQELLRSSPEAATRNEEYERMKNQLEEASKERQAVPEEIQHMAADEQEDRIVAGFRQQALGTSPQAESRPRVLWVAAAGIAALLLVWFSRGEDVPREDPTFPLGDATSSCSPRGEVSRYGTFRWELELPRNGRFELSFYDAVTGQLLHREEEWEETLWTYAAEQHGTWPQRLRWQVVVLGADGSATSVGCESEAWLP